MRLSEGIYLEKGIPQGSTRNPEEFFKLGCEQGDAKSCRHMGKLLLDSNDSDEEVADTLKKACSFGDSSACAVHKLELKK